MNNFIFWTINILCAFLIGFFTFKKETTSVAFSFSIKYFKEQKFHFLIISITVVMLIFQCSKEKDNEDELSVKDKRLNAKIAEYNDLLKKITFITDRIDNNTIRLDSMSQNIIKGTENVKKVSDSNYRNIKSLGNTSSQIHKMNEELTGGTSYPLVNYIYTSRNNTYVFNVISKGQYAVRNIKAKVMVTDNYSNNYSGSVFSASTYYELNFDLGVISIREGSSFEIPIKSGKVAFFIIFTSDNHQWFQHILYSKGKMIWVYMDGMKTDGESYFVEPGFEAKTRFEKYIVDEYDKSRKLRRN
jgi:hypothetical protein